MPRGAKGLQLALCTGDLLQCWALKEINSMQGMSLTLSLALPQFKKTFFFSISLITIWPTKVPYHYLTYRSLLICLFASFLVCCVFLKNSMLLLLQMIEEREDIFSCLVCCLLLSAFGNFLGQWWQTLHTQEWLWQWSFWMLSSKH